MSFEIVTDSSSNLLDETIDRFNLHILSLSYLVGDKEYPSYVKGQKTDLKHFYDLIREGNVITTSLPHIHDSEQLIRSLLDAGKDVLYIGFSSGLSGTYESTVALLNELRPQYPERVILDVDTLAASGGEGLLVYKAAQMREAGKSIQEVHQWLEDTKLHLAHWYTVTDLMYLFRGGRVKRTSAWAGTMLNIKPVMHMDNEGHLIPLEKVMGRKKSILGMLKHMKEDALEPVSQQTVFITHGDCEDDANFLADKIRQTFGVTDIHINYVEPVIGAHTGPGVLALFFLADHR